MDILSSREAEKTGTVSRSFVVYPATNDGSPSVASLANVLPQRLLENISVDTDTPSEVQFAGREEIEGGVDSSMRVAYGAARRHSKVSGPEAHPVNWTKWS